MVDNTLDDLDSRQGSATSLLRTLAGTAIHDFGGWMAVADTVHFMELLGVDSRRTRTAIVRVKNKGHLVPEKREGRNGYRLSQQATEALRWDDQWLRNSPRMEEGELWCLISFSIPESDRSVRQLLRRHLRSERCGLVAPGLWIVPSVFTEQVVRTLDALGVGDRVTRFDTADPVTPDGLSAAVRTWWDLDDIAARHRWFIATFGTDGDTRTPPNPEHSFSMCLRAVDAWRNISRLDPGLPTSLLPPDWPGVASRELFARILDAHASIAYLWALETLIERAAPRERSKLIGIRHAANESMPTP